MSKENANLRLLGSPVNLTCRGKKKADKKNIRNRPKSALQNSCFTPENLERYKRPFSAENREKPTTRSFLKTFSEDLLQNRSNTPHIIKIVAPTTEILGDTSLSRSNQKRKDFCSNASDYGSEDTYMSLGAKIKSKAQVSKPKPQSKNILKYRNIIRKGQKPMANNFSENNKNEYGLNIKITERQHSTSPKRNNNLFNERALSPSYKTRPYESNYIPIDSEHTQSSEDLAGRVSFGILETETDVQSAIDTYSKRIILTKQQLSLVEEESTGEFDSVPSQNASSLSPENSIDDIKNNIATVKEQTAMPFSVTAKEDYPTLTQEVNEARTYTSFYDDFHSNEPFKSKMSSTVYNDASSKDSGYHDGLLHYDQHKRDYSLPPTSSLVKTSQSHEDIDEPKSLNFSQTGKNDFCAKTFPTYKKAWAEPLNHSRLLYKDFFLQKEGHLAVPPQNSPSKITVDIPGTQNTRPELDNNEYPHYLYNSSTKAYTSKVIEDYKKELETINSLHELTLKDLKTDAFSPTPFNIDTMFEHHSRLTEENLRNVNQMSEPQNKRENENRKVDVSKVSTKELIQHYWKVKENDYNKSQLPKQNKKLDHKITNFTTDLSNKKLWNNKKLFNNLPLNTKAHAQKNLFTMSNTPHSARIESVQNDKDIDSWMSLSAPSPRYLETSPVESPTEHKDFNIGIQPSAEENVHTANNIIVNSDTEIQNNTQRDNNEVLLDKKALDSKSTVFDIYSMLKDIESFGECPVSSVTNKDVTATEEQTVTKSEERAPTPKDNFMEIFEFLEKVEQSANDALSVVTSTTPSTIPKLEALLKLPHTELAQRLMTASLQLEERSCCIALLQESLANHKEQMVAKVSNLEKQSLRNVAKVKHECEEAIRRHQNFIDQLINDKKTLNHRIEQLVDERRSLEERWKRQAQTLEERYKLELRNQHDKMAAAQQVARQRWVRQKAEKIKELTVKGLEGELREMAERQQKEIADLKMAHAEQIGKAQARHSVEMEEMRRQLEDEKEAALVKERQVASSRLEKQILELELTYQEQRRRLVAEMRAENERLAEGLGEKERAQRDEMVKWKEEQERLIEEKRKQLEEEISKEKGKLENQMNQKQKELEDKFEQFKKEFEAEQQIILKRKVSEIAAQHKLERDREIEKAIESMEAEAQAGRKELQDAIRRNKEQYEGELKELAETEQATLRRYQEAQQRVRQTEDKCAELEMTVSQLETRNKVLVEKNSQLEAQVSHVRAGCEQTWQITVDKLKQEMEDLKRTHEEQMHQLYAKVKVAVARKDSAIQALTREAAKYQEKITMLEQKLQQQRKDFLKHK